MKVVLKLGIMNRLANDGIKCMMTGKSVGEVADRREE